MFVQENRVSDNQHVEHAASGAAAKRVAPERSLELALAAARTAAENGGSDVVVLDMTRHTAIFDYFVIATGTSRRQLHAMSVLDYGTVVIHLFDDDTRKFYSLEALWADAGKVDLTETMKGIRKV